MCYVKEDNLHELFLTYTNDRDISGTFSQRMMLDSNANGPFNVHDSRQVGFQIVMQIIHVLCWGVTLEERQIAENRLDKILK